MFTKNSYYLLGYIMAETLTLFYYELDFGNNTLDALRSLFKNKLLFMYVYVWVY